MESYRVSPPAVARGWSLNPQTQVGFGGTVPQALRQQGYAVEGFDEPSSFPNPWPSLPGMDPSIDQGPNQPKELAPFQQDTPGEALVEAACERGFRPRRRAGR